MTDVQYHLLIEGFLGELEGVELTDGCLTMKDAEGIFRIQVIDDI